MRRFPSDEAPRRRRRTSTSPRSGRPPRRPLRVPATTASCGTCAPAPRRPSTSTRSPRCRATARPRCRRAPSFCPALHRAPDRRPADARAAAQGRVDPRVEVDRPTSGPCSRSSGGRGRPEAVGRARRGSGRPGQARLREFAEALGREARSQRERTLRCRRGPGPADPGGAQARQRGALFGGDGPRGRRRRATQPSAASWPRTAPTSTATAR